MHKLSKDRTAYELTGPGDAPVIAFIHGLGLNRQVWEPYVEHFARRYRVLNYDLLGHGETETPLDRIALSAFSEQLVGLLDALSISQAVLVGFSLGGMINRRLAMDHPARVRALAILNSPHEREPQAQRQVEKRALDSAGGGPEANLDATVERWFTAEFRAQSSEFINRVRTWILANDADNYARARQVLATGVIELIRPQPPIELPSLVMTCENDSGSTPAMSHAIASEIDGARVIVAPKLQHMGLTERSSIFIDALDDFIDALPL